MNNSVKELQATIIILLSQATIEEDVDGETFPDGNVIDHTKYFITMGLMEFEQLVEALGIKVPLTGSAYEELKKEMERMEYEP